MITLGLDIGSNSVGSAWIDSQGGKLITGTSIFPAGVDESDEKRGDPKNAKRRMTRHSRVTLARRASRKRHLRLKLISVGLLPSDSSEFKSLLEETNPFDLRAKGLEKQLTPHEFGRVLLHLAQRRGALGLKIAELDDAEASDEKDDDGKVKAAIRDVREKMRERNAKTFGQFIARLQAERTTAITTEDRRPIDCREGPREYRAAIRNKAGSYEHCADRAMIREEFAQLWDKQKKLGGSLADKLTDELRRELDDESGDAIWRHKGRLFGQRRTYWDTGTLGRCDLEPTERCVPHADMYASQYLVVETINNLKIIERGKEPRPLDKGERQKIQEYLSGPLGLQDKGKQKGQPKRTVSVTDLRDVFKWGRASKTSQFRFNIESDEDRLINTDWFAREIIHGAVTLGKWQSLPDSAREGINSAVLKFDPDNEQSAGRLRELVMKEWAGLTAAQADALVAACQKRPKLEKRLKMSRRAARNLLALMDRAEPWPDPKCPGQFRWLTEIEARKLIAEDANFKDITTGKPLDAHARRRYATGAKGATARDRHYMQKHLIKKNGQPIFGPDGLPLHEPPPAPLISNPVVRKAIHEVRRHIIEYMATFERQPDSIHVELSREAKMGKKDADEVLFRNRLRKRISNDIIATFGLDSRSSTQQRTAVERVVLCVQQGGVCPLCGNQTIPTRITPRMAANGEGCQVAHIIPKASGGHNGLGNIVLSHTKCNLDMRRRTPREFWNQTLKGGFAEGIAWVEKIYTDIERPKSSEIKNATADALWSCYFVGKPKRKGPTFDELKILQFKKDVKDIQEMTNRQDAATKYAARQVMAYLADAIFDGNGLPERGGERLIYATDGMWTSRLRREWGLFFDPHKVKAKGLSDEDEGTRKEKNRGDHRHHAIDAAVIALCTRQVQIEWENREKQADKEGVNTANEEAMEAYRRSYPLSLPAPFKTREELREAVRRAVFGAEEIEQPICHRPVKRKIIGALHEETLFGPVLDKAGKLTEYYTAKKSVLALEPNHLRMPREETEKEAIERLAARRQRISNLDEKAARKWARGVVSSPGYHPAIIEPPPGKSGLVRDLALRRQIRTCLSEYLYAKMNKNGQVIGEAQHVNPDDFSDNEIKQAVEAGAIRQKSGVPIRSVVMLRVMSDPVIASRWATDHQTGKRYRVYDAITDEGDAAAARAYLGGNNHHIEIRVAKDKKGNDVWSGEIVTTFTAAQRKLAKLRAFRKARVPKLKEFRKLPNAEQEKWLPVFREIEKVHPIVNRSDNEIGRFVMSLCEGETLFMRHKQSKEVGYFVVAKLDKPQSIVLVPHWDARAATQRKDAAGQKVANSEREDFSVTPTDLKELAAPGHEHAVKVRVSPLGKVTELTND